MKKSVLIISGTVLLGAVIGALLFFLRSTTDTEQPKILKSPVQTTQHKNEELHERRAINLKTASGDISPNNATLARPGLQQHPEKGQQPGEEDKYVTLNFLDDLISLAVKHYHPAHSVSNANRYGKSSLNAKILNTHYGVSLQGLEPPTKNTNRARQAILSYALTPRTLSFLFDLYGEECVTRTDEKLAATNKKYPGPGQKIIERPLSTAQKKEFFSLCAKKMRDMGKIISRIAELPGFTKKIQTYHRLRKELNNAYYTFWELNENNTKKETIDASANAIKKAILVFDRNKKNLVSSIVNVAHPVITSNDEVLYIAEWVSRRITNQSISKKTIKALGMEIEKLAQAFAQHEETIQ